MNVNVPQETIEMVEARGLKIVESIKFFGAHTIINDNHTKEYELNFTKANEQTDNYLQRMEQRYISSIGASIIYNSKVLSKFTHLLYNFHPSSQDCQKMDNRARSFVKTFAGGRFLVKKMRYFIPFEMAGLGLRNFENFSKSLMSHWLKQMQREDAAHNQNWTSVLRYLLAGLGLKIHDIQHLGFKDLEKIGYKLHSKSFFWSQTFLKLSELVKDAEKQHKDTTTLPIFGGTLAHRANRPGMSIFSPRHGLSFRKLI